MPRNYTQIEHLSAEIFRRKRAGERDRQTAGSYHLAPTQGKGLLTRQKQNAPLLERGYTPHRKGRPSRKGADKLPTLPNESVKLQIRVETPQNFPSEAGKWRSANTVSLNNSGRDIPPRHSAPFRKSPAADIVTGLCSSGTRQWPLPRPFPLPSRG